MTSAAASSGCGTDGSGAGWARPLMLIATQVAWNGLELQTSVSCRIQSYYSRLFGTRLRSASAKLRPPCRIPPEQALQGEECHIHARGNASRRDDIPVLDVAHPTHQLDVWMRL